MLKKIERAIRLVFKNLMARNAIREKVNIRILFTTVLTLILVLSVFGNFSLQEEIELSEVKSKIKPQTIEVSQIELEKEVDNLYEFELRKSYLKSNVNELEKKEDKKVLKASGNLSGKEMTVIYDNDYEDLLRIVEAEATDEDFLGKQLVANVVLNRVKSDEFPNSIHAVVHQRIRGRAQFSPIDDGRFYSVKISDLTRKAVDSALRGEDKSENALFFVAKSLTTRKASSWFDNNLEFLFKHGVHSFYKY